MFFKKTNVVQVFDCSAIAATFWLMTRYQETGCKQIARQVEQHLFWLGENSDSPTLSQACRKLSLEWREAPKDKLKTLQ